MASMYAAFQSDINGFRIQASNSDDHSRLLSLATGISHGAYPQTTSRRDAYPFVLNHQGSGVLPFNWTDHRGDATFLRSDNEESAKLESDLAQADAILVFFACDALSARRTSPAQIRRLVTLIAQAISSRSSHAVIALVLTKADLVEEIDDELIEPIKTLIECIASSREVLGTLIPVACGPELANVLLPPIYALRFGLIQKHNATVSEAESSARRVLELDDEGSSLGGMFGAAMDWFNGNETVYKKAERWRGYLRNEIALYERLAAAAEGLDKYLADLPKF